MPTKPQMQPVPAPTDWSRVASHSEFKALMAAKVKFVIPATIFFMIYYFALPVLAGYAPGLMERQILGPVNFAYLFALSQFFMTGIVAYLYMRAAGRFDRMAQSVLKQIKGGQIE